MLSPRPESSEGLTQVGESASKLTHKAVVSFGFSPCGLSIGMLITRYNTVVDFSERVVEKEATVFCNLISEVTSYHFFFLNEYISPFVFAFEMEVSYSLGHFF